MTTDIHVLHVDDSAAFRDLVAELLERVDDRITVSPESDPTRVTRRIDTEPIDCVVSDYHMPPTDGLALCREVRARHPDLPFFLFTSEYNDELVEEAMAAGVTDFVEKEPGVTHYKVLANRIRNAVHHHRIRQRIEGSTERS